MFPALKSIPTNILNTLTFFTLKLDWCFGEYTLQIFDGYFIINISIKYLMMKLIRNRSKYVA